MRIPLYQVDAFTSRLFGGNPAAVCPLAEWLSETTMQSIAAENNLAETAFFVAQGEGYLLRWFTPTVEVELCGHATLASGYVVTHILMPDRRSVRFDTLRAGPLEVTRDGDRLAMDFPAWPTEREPANPRILAALSKRPAPNHGVDEDPATGSAHCVLTPYWAGRLGKKQLKARQISARTGDLECTLRGDRVTLTGHAVLYLEGSITV